jgi:photosystem II stability/assembly factor-like uncharacterized protein
MPNRAFRIVGPSCLALVLLAGCSSKKLDVGEKCLLNSDCNSPLVCTIGTCHMGCRETRDCPAGQSCTMAGGVGVCQLPAEAECSATVACGPLWICASDLRCRANCSTAANCAGGQVCVQGFCADTQELEVTTGELPQKQMLADAAVPDAAAGAEVDLDLAESPDTSAPDAPAGPEVGPDLAVDTANPLTAANLIAAPQSLPFGSVAVGQTSKESAVMLVNIGQEASGKLSFAVDNSEFAIAAAATGDCSSGATILRPSESCAIRVTLTPAGTGARTGTLSFSAPPGDSSVVRLSGTGTCAADTIPDESGQCVLTAGAEWVQRGALLNWTSVASSADGNRLVAAAPGGNIYTSSDSGATWIARETSRSWTSVASSADGSRLLAGSDASGSAGDLFTSRDFGENWNPCAVPNRWKAVASAADGIHLFARSEDAAQGDISLSTDGGTTWTVAKQDVLGIGRTGVAVSADGSRIMLPDVTTGLRLSPDGGTTWTTSGLGLSWNAVAISGDGSLLIGATGASEGYIYLSRDAGVSWSQVGPAQDWWSVAASSDGKRLLAAAEGGYLFHSIDGGKTWNQRATAGYWRAVASSADGTKLVAVASQGYIYTSSGPLP